jgi:RND family efflux transporter MFP subunit
MTTASAEQHHARGDAPAVRTSDLAKLRGLQRKLLQHVSSSPDKVELLQELAAIISEFSESAVVHYFERNQTGELASSHRLHSASDDTTDQTAKQLLALSQAACGNGEVAVREQAVPARLFISAPVALRGQGPEAIGVVFTGNEEPRHLILLLQIVASHVVLWHVLQKSSAQEASALDSAVLLELLERIEQAPTLGHACHVLVGGLQGHLNCRRVALGLRPSGKGRCRIAAMSGSARFDRRSPIAQSIEAACDEAIIRNELTVWPTTDAATRHGALAHKAVCTTDDAKSAISIPLSDQNGNSIGAIVVLDEPDDATQSVSRFLRAAAPSLATSLGVMQRLEGGRLAKFARATGRVWKSWKGKVALVLIALLLAAMAIPLPYKVNCDCQLEPVTRRFVAAPFEGTLEKALVKPGDMVREGDILARIDGREIRWERASVEADRNQAVKKRDAAQATHNYSEAQIARLEMERLALKLQLLDHHSANLEIRSPVDGVVASGDLDRAEGAPLTIGQTLFEIAPLEKMIIEVSVEDDEISNITKGQKVQVRLDAFPGEVWEAVVTKVHPRSEIRDEQNVFIAEVELDNTAGNLRPGMKGRAKIVTPTRTLGWILFHKPWEFAAKKLTW